MCSTITVRKKFLHYTAQCEGFSFTQIIDKNHGKAQWWIKAQSHEMDILLEHERVNKIIQFFSLWADGFLWFSIAFCSTNKKKNFLFSPMKSLTKFENAKLYPPQIPSLWLVDVLLWPSSLDVLKMRQKVNGGFRCSFSGSRADFCKCIFSLDK